MDTRHLALAAIAAIAGLLGAAVTATAEDAASERPTDADAVIPLYTSVAPGSETWTWHEQVSVRPLGGRGGLLVRNVVQPTLTLFKPINSARVSHTAVIVAPGGGFRWLSIDSEGYDVARALAARGVTALVLKYRLQHTAEDEAAFRAESLAFARSLSLPKAAKGETPSVPPAVAKISVSPSDNPGIADGIAAVRYVRQHAAELGIDPNRIGMVGFSAGGAVTIGTILHGDAASRLDFAAPVYGAFNASGLWPASTPPIFLAAAGDDAIASQAEIEAFNTLRAQGLPVELHIYEKGGHGFGMIQLGATTDGWFDALVEWLASRGLMTP